MRYLLILFALVLAVPAFGADCTATSTSLLPSTYTRSAATLSAGLAASALVEPLDANGLPSATGKRGFLLIGMSNANQVGSAFKTWYDQDTRRDTKTVYVNGAVSGKGSSEWANPADSAWTTAATRVTQAGLTAPQVQWAHVVMAIRQPGTNGPMTEAQVRTIVDRLLVLYPNIRGLWLSGISYMGYSTLTLTYEPYVHDEGLLMASLVGTLPVFSDFLDWWSPGTAPNPLTGITWSCGDVQSDGVHPAITGRGRLALLQIDRWRVDPVMSWMWLP